MSEVPEIPLPLASQMQQLHELFTSLLAAGFTEHQALVLLSNIVANQRPPGDPTP